MKHFIAIVASAITLVPSVSMADGGRWRAPERFEEHHRGGGFNPWPFVAGAVVGGIIVNEYNRPRVITSRQPEPPVDGDQPLIGK